METITILTDGQELTGQENFYRQLPKKILNINSGKITIKCVGILMNHSELLISIPKHFPFPDSTNFIDIKKIVQLLIRSLYKYRKGSTYSEDSHQINNNFPYDSILYIISYFDKYGIYINEHDESSQKIGSRVNWNLSFAKAQKVISDDNVIYLPLFYKKKVEHFTFISECMSFMLNYLASNLKVLFDINKDRLSNYDTNSFTSYEVIVNRLKQCRRSQFKDINIKLVNCLISFFAFLSTANNQYYLYTTNFQYVWEASVEKYLNQNFSHYDNNSFVFHATQNSFIKETFCIDCQVDKSNQKNISIDHFMIKDDKIYLFDSKYYSTVNALNYKQIAYNYFVNTKYNTNHQMTIINALILPSSKDIQFTRCHIDRNSLDGVYIHELYLPFLSVLKNYIKP